MRTHKTQSDIFRLISDIQMINFFQQAHSNQLSEKAKHAEIATHRALDPPAEDKSGQQEKMDIQTHLNNVLLWHNNDMQSW